MKANWWEKTFGAKRRASDKALLAALERDIADGERIAAADAKRAGTSKLWDERMEVMWQDRKRLDGAERERIARAFGRPA